LTYLGCVYAYAIRLYVSYGCIHLPFVLGDDGGSCIDGRLTSAWNWCSKLHKKPYYYVFMFTGFQGFDGDWKEN
jgi:hypothetical protein